MFEAIRPYNVCPHDPSEGKNIWKYDTCISSCKQLTSVLFLQKSDQMTHISALTLHISKAKVCLSKQQA